MARMAAASTSSELARAEGVLIAREMLMEARSMVQGVQVSAPLGKFTAAVDVIEALGQRAES
jgi:homocysteine S-methyltransferase